MSVENIQFMKETGGTAINKLGYDVRTIKNTTVPYDAFDPESRGIRISEHTTITNPKIPEHYKSITKFEDGTIVSHLSTFEAGLENEPFSRTRIKGRDGKWYLLEYRNGFFGWQNSEILERGKKTLDEIKVAENLSPIEQRMLLRKINAPIAPQNKVYLIDGVYPELHTITKFSPNLNICFSDLSLYTKSAEEIIQKNKPVIGLTKKESEKLVKIYVEAIRQQAESRIEEGKALIESSKTWLNAIKKIHR